MIELFFELIRFFLIILKIIYKAAKILELILELPQMPII